MEERTPKIAKEYLEHYKKVNYGMMPEWVWDMAIKALDQEPKTGHWIPLGNYDDYGNECSYKCSECGDVNTYDYNFCPNCGCRMIEQTIRK